jgi:replicative DNA helicase
MRPDESDPRRAANASRAEVDRAGRRDDGTAGVSRNYDTFGPYPLTVDLVEAAVLGAMLLYRPALEGATAMLTSEDFDRPAHQLVFATAAAMHAEDAPVDPVTVTVRLADAGRLEEAGDAGFASELVDPLACPAPTSWAAYALLVQREGRRRRGISLLRRALVRLEAGADPDTIATELRIAA